MSKTILYFLDDPSRDKHFHDYILSGLEKAGYDPIVVYFWMGQSESQLEKLGHKIINLGCSRDSYRRFNPGLFFKIVNALKKYNAAAVHVQRYHPLIYLAMAVYSTRLPVFFYTIRSTKLIRNLNRRFFFSISSTQITMVVAVSRGVKDDLLKRSDISAKKVEVISNGLDPSVFDLKVDKKKTREAFDLPRERFLFGMAARFKKAKDHKGLVDAFSKIKKRCKSACLVLAGDGPLEEEIRSLVRAKELDKEVFFLGKISPEKIPLFLKTLDVFVHPSWREGMPASILEAMASGLPVIATDAEGVSDIFATERRFGYILPRGDINLFAKAMAEMFYLSESELNKMGKEAMARVNEAFTHNHMVEKTVALYNRFIGER